MAASSTSSVNSVHKSSLSVSSGGSDSLRTISSFPGAPPSGAPLRPYPSYGHTRVASSNFLVFTPNETKRNSPSLLSLLTIVIASGALPAVLLIVLFARRVDPAVVLPGANGLRGALIVDEGGNGPVNATDNLRTEQGTLYGLSAVSMITTITTLCLPLQLTLIAYSVVSDWAKAVPSGDRGLEEARPLAPTTFEYGLLVKLFSTPAAPTTVWNSSRYLFGHRSLRSIPTCVVHGIWTVLLISALTYAVSLADLWLHLEAGPIAYYAKGSQLSGSALPSSINGFAINKTTCPGPSVLADNPGANCLFQWGNGGDLFELWNTSFANEGFLAASGQSKVARMETVDGVAVIAPLMNDTGYSWKAPSFGSSLQCGPPPCVQNGTLCSVEITDPRTGRPYYEANRTLDSAVLADPDSFLYDPQHAASSSGNHSFGLGSNPFGSFTRLAMPSTTANKDHSNGTGAFHFFFPGQAISVESEQDGFVLFASEPTDPHNGWVSGAEIGGGGVATVADYVSLCNITMWNVDLSYENGALSIDSKTLADFDTTSALSFGWTSGVMEDANFYAHLQWFGLPARLTGQMSTELFPVPFSTWDKDFQRTAAMFGLSAAVGLMSPVPASTAARVDLVISSRYPWAPLVTYLVLCWLYTIVALAAFFKAFCTRSATVLLLHPDGTTTESASLTELLHMRLVEPLTLISDSGHHSRRLKDANFAASKATISHSEKSLFAEDEEMRMYPQVEAGRFSVQRGHRGRPRDLV